MSGSHNCYIISSTDKLIHPQNSPKDRGGFGFKDGELWWVGWVLAAAANGAQFMLTSKFQDLNLGIVVLGLSAYVYSIFTNVIGIEGLQVEKNSYIAWGAGFFLDIYPEMAIAWALRASREGDLIGNLWKMLSNYESLLPRNGGQPQQKQSQQHQSPQYNQVMQNLPRSVTKTPTLSNEEMRSKSERYENQQKQNLPPFLQNQNKPDPTYHPEGHYQPSTRKPGRETRKPTYEA